LRRLAAPIALAVVAVASMACSLLPPTIECGPLDPTTCQQRAQQLVAEGQRGDPTRRIVRLTFTDDRGSYTAEYDDGTGTSLIVD
jgi:hypothetical protein